MANVVFNRKEIEKHIKLTQEVIDKISYFGTPLEHIDEQTLEIEVFPNRPDLLSLEGFIRGFKAFLGKETGLKKYQVHAPEKNFKVKIDSSVKDIRPYTVCAIIKNLSLDDSKIKTLIDLQEKLHNTLGRNRKKSAIGIYPLEKITLPIRYLAKKPEEISFIPLEMDSPLTGTQILRKHPKGRDYAHLLEDKDKYPIFIDSKNEILSMPPIINSHQTGKVTEKTKDVFVECSGSHYETLEKTLNIIVTTLAEMGGKIYAMELDYGKKTITPNLTPKKMKISLENTNKLLGLNLKEKDLEKLLPKMGHQYQKGQVLIPAWRSDILHEVDIIEDIAIAYGYEKIIPEVPQIATIAEEAIENKIKSKIAEILVGIGMLETSTYHFVKEEEIKKINPEQKIEVESSKTEYKYLRPNLLIPALRIISENKDNEYPQKIFEMGTTYTKDSSQETGINESENLSILIAPGTFTSIKQILDYLTSLLKLEYTLEEAINMYSIEGRTGKILINSQPIGYIGEINPSILRERNIKTPLAFIEISLEDIFKYIKSN
ncbi:phenylalanine--tRNA ligase subunit beta [Candidatus Pacearchaeota archaeon CG10_big_fil_rev_8_21_14_0_10_31_24]|nr:MAG: phenylalanine--tRNA ligase subunit beta [Candidatus Pacearchaeota archaeon CG10_big_fil_rev_8_21_14_0_10_31_24]